jgi:hypothetical protein
MLLKYATVENAYFKLEKKIASIDIKGKEKKNN